MDRRYWRSQRRPSEGVGGWVFVLKQVTCGILCNHIINFHFFNNIIEMFGTNLPCLHREPDLQVLLAVSNCLSWVASLGFVARNVQLHNSFVNPLDLEMEKAYKIAHTICAKNAPNFAKLAKMSNIAKKKAKNL